MANGNNTGFRGRLRNFLGPKSFDFLSKINNALVRKPTRGGDFPSTVVGGEFPSTTIGGDLPSTTIGGEFPGAQIGGQFPTAPVGGPFPGTQLGGPIPTTQLQVQDPQAAAPTGEIDAGLQAQLEQRVLDGTLSPRAADAAARLLFGGAEGPIAPVSVGGIDPGLRSELDARVANGTLSPESADAAARLLFGDTEGDFVGPVATDTGAVEGPVPQFGGQGVAGGGSPAEGQGGLTFEEFQQNIANSQAREELRQQLIGGTAQDLAQSGAPLRSATSDELLNGQQSQSQKLFERAINAFTNLETSPASTRIAELETLISNILGEQQSALAEVEITGGLTGFQAGRRNQAINQAAGKLLQPLTGELQAREAQLGRQEESASRLLGLAESARPGAVGSPIVDDAGNVSVITQDISGNFQTSNLGKIASAKGLQNSVTQIDAQGNLILAGIDPATGQPTSTVLASGFRVPGASGGTSRAIFNAQEGIFAGVFDQNNNLISLVDTGLTPSQTGTEQFQAEIANSINKVRNGESTVEFEKSILAPLYGQKEVDAAFKASGLDKNFIQKIFD